MCQGYPRYCAVTAGADGTVQLTGGRSRRGKYRGPPASRDLVTDALRSCDDAAFVDFLRRCLVLDPQARMTPAEALRHPWISMKRGNCHDKHQPMQQVQYLGLVSCSLPHNAVLTHYKLLRLCLSVCLSVCLHCSPCPS